MANLDGDYDDADAAYRNVFYSAMSARHSGKPLGVGGVRRDVFAAQSSVQHEPYVVDDALLGAIEQRAEVVALSYAQGIAQRNQQMHVGYVNNGAPLFGHSDAEADQVEQALYR